MEPGAERIIRKLDATEKIIVKELIKDPRISDNKISEITNIPVATVNRKRKILEEEGLLHYFAYLDNTNRGTKQFGSRQLYIIRMRRGITREDFVNKIKGEPYDEVIAKHICEAALGEFDGQLALLFVIESRVESDILEIFNAEILPRLKKYYGEDVISDVKVINLTTTLRLLHNYLPLQNTEQGKLKKDWSNDWIFVSE